MRIVKLYRMDSDNIDVRKRAGGEHHLKMSPGNYSKSPNRQLGCPNVQNSACDVLDKLGHNDWVGSTGSNEKWLLEGWVVTAQECPTKSLPN